VLDFSHKKNKEEIMAMLEVKCPLCHSHKVVKFGMSPEGKQRYQCRNAGCGKNTFLLDYTNKGYLPEIKKQIIEMTLNGSGIRDTSRVLGIGQNTVISELKKRNRNSTGKLHVTCTIELRSY
jgi:transposase-like protein